MKVIVHADILKIVKIFLYYVPKQLIILTIVSVSLKKSVNFTKAKAKCSLSLYCNGDESCLHTNETKISKSEGLDNVTPYRICLGSCTYM